MSANTTQPAPWFSLGTIALGIETSNPSSARPTQKSETTLGVAVARCDELDSNTNQPRWTQLHTEPLRVDNPQHDDLASCIDRCVRAANLMPRQLNAICVSIGPGGFTSVRVAVVTTKMICEATGAACIGVPSADVVIHAIAQNTNTSPQSIAAASRPDVRATTAIALASKGDNTFITLFDNKKMPIRDGFLCDASKLRNLYERDDARTLIADHFLPAAIREQATALGMQIVPPTYSPFACIHAAAHRQPVDPAQLLPLYPREPEAVTKWRLLHG